MAETTPGLKRQIGLWSAIAIVIGTTIGSGIFRSPAGIADRLPGPLPLAAIWVAGGLFALCGALSLSEVASAFPRTGGVFVFIKEGFGRLPAFLFGWAEITIIRAAAVGAIAITFSEYLLRVIGIDPSLAPNDAYARYVAAAAIIAMGTVNILGVRWGTLVLNITTLAKYGGLLFIIIIALAIGLPRTGGHFTPAAPPGSFAFGAFGLALVSVLWAYDGWADLSFTAGEVKDPERNLPKALIGGTLAVIGIYLLANLAYMAVLPVEEIRRSRLVAADVAQRLIGQAGVVFVGVTVMLSTFGTLTGSLLTSPRIFYAMAEDGLFFRTVGRVHPRFHTPHIAIAINIVVAVVFVLVRTFEQLADAFVTAIVPFYALGVASIFMLRRRPDYAPAFRVPGYPFVPTLFVLSTLYLLGNALLDASSRVATAAVLGIVLLGIPVFYLTVGRKQGVSAPR
jgi:APA family basic amino acid/polyamine antiporter